MPQVETEVMVLEMAASLCNGLIPKIVELLDREAVRVCGDPIFIPSHREGFCMRMETELVGQDTVNRVHNAFHRSIPGAYYFRWERQARLTTLEE